MYPRLLALLALITAISLVSPVHAQVETPGTETGIDLSTIRVGDTVVTDPTQLDPYLEKLLANIASFQADFRHQWGTYAQTLPAFSLPPADGKAELPSLQAKTKAPTSGVTVETLYLVAGMEAFPADVHIDVYNGPSGTGYVLVAQLEFDKNVLQRAFNVGPEDWRQSSKWSEVNTEP